MDFDFDLEAPVDEHRVLDLGGQGKGPGGRKGRFEVENAVKWLSAGKPARRVNAGLAVGFIDRVTLEIREDAKSLFYSDDPSANQERVAGVI